MLELFYQKLGQEVHFSCRCRSCSYLQSHIDTTGVHPHLLRWMIRPEHAWPAISKFLQAHLPIGVLFAAIFGPVGSHYCLTLIHVETPVTLDACTQDPPDSIGLPRTTGRNPIFVTYRNSRQRCNAFSGVPFTMSSKIVIITIFLDLGPPSWLSPAISTVDALLCSCICD